MKIRKLVTSSVLTMLLASAAFADHITVDYNHHVNFQNYRTYSWGKIETSNSLWNSRVKEAISSGLAAKGWTEVPSGGQVTVDAVDKTHIQPEMNTFYNGFGGRRWGGFGDATTTVENYKIGTLAIDMFDTSSKNMIWRGVSSGALSGNPEKNDKNMSKEVRKMFEHFPPKAAA